MNGFTDTERIDFLRDELARTILQPLGLHDSNVERCREKFRSKLDFCMRETRALRAGR